MISVQKHQTLNYYIDVIHEMLSDQLNGLQGSSNRQISTHRALFARLFGQMLYDAPKVYTGMASAALIVQKLRNFALKPCPEHHRSRNRGGQLLVDLVEYSLRTGEPISRNDVELIVKQHCEVHFTTPEENIRLRKHQQFCTSEAAYVRAGIKLIPAFDLFCTRGRMTDRWKAAMSAKYSHLLRVEPPVEMCSIWPDIVH